ncbi:DUF4191 domain-containing protein [Canibacter zhoujuaniae]|uniref:DUF4191 domain-containing protein n=1 Tax=Canibacter zhoujuaniae TaxID=2708343 RepID=UPI00142141AC|nr:DUF4191 domain-containing protein [Canibacter zhoujuaniae]
MAKEKTQREPGRIKQMIQVYKTTKQHDKNLPFVLLFWFLAPILIAIALPILLPGAGIVSWILWPLTGIMAGILAAMIVLGRRAERVIYTQIEGQPGAVGAVLANGLRRSYRGSEVPAAVSARTKDAVYRAVGKAGVVLVGEGRPDRLGRLMGDEERKVKRALPSVPVHRVYVGNETPEQVPLHQLPKTIYRFKGALRRNEVTVVHNRLQALQGAPVGIPKGVDPNRVRRPSKPR